MQFLYPSLTWGFLLVLVPVLIHLINLLRHRRVRWAAMDFLLQSHQQHRRWVWLRQFLLLASRMAILALLVALLAHWITRDHWFAVFGGRATHHYILLDDSYSMGERIGSATAFDRGRQVVAQLAARAAAQDTPQKFTLIRYSRAQLGSTSAADSQSADLVADFNAEPVDGDFDQRLEERHNALEVTQLDVAPLAALNLLRQLVGAEGNEKRIAYIVSDFRRKDWDQPTEIRSALEALTAQGVELHLVGCVQRQQQNLGIVDLEPAEETRAAGVPLFVNVGVRNYGPAAARNVQLRVATTYFDQQPGEAAVPGRLDGRLEQLPTVLIEEIPPATTVTRRVQVYFPRPGRHIVEASLPEDPLTVDNRRWCVIDLPPGEPVLLVDGTPAQRHAYYLRSVFQPGPRATTGILPDVQPPAFLRDVPLDALRRYQAVYLLEVPRLDERAVENLERYVREGGGLGVFVGSQVSLSFYNDQLYREGQGLLPLPLDQEQRLAPQQTRTTRAPDVEVTSHPIFQAFHGARNPLLRTVAVERYLKPPAGWQPDPQSSVDVVARLRNQDPLVVTRSFGEGRVAAFLTTLAPDWNNWALDPSLVVVALRMQAHLSAGHRGETSRRVGTPLEVELDAGQYQAEVAFVVPGSRPETRIVVDRPAQPPTGQEDSPILLARLDRSLAADLVDGQTNRQGVYEAWTTNLAGDTHVRRWALNVQPEGGDLTLASPERIAERLHPVRTEFYFAGDQSLRLWEQAGYDPSLLLLFALVSLLIAEQVMGYFASYHPPRRAGG